MTTKFAKSNINITGLIAISFTDNNGNIEKSIPVQLNGLNKSKSGVYCLCNKLNGRLYIGMARNLEVRKNRHWRDIRNDEHCNELIQKDFNDLTESSYNNQFAKVDDLFEFEVIIYCRPSELTFYEHLLITHLNPYYNVHKQKEIVVSDVDPFYKHICGDIDLKTTVEETND